MPDTPTPSSLDAAIQALKQAQQAEADAKATQEAIRKGLLPELQALTELLGGTVAPPKPPVIPRLTGWLSSLPHIPLIYVVVAILGLIVIGERLPGITNLIHLPTIGKPRPITAPLHATLVFDVNAMDQPLAAIRTSPTLEAALTAQNCAWRAFDVHDPLAVKLGHAAKAATLGGPPVLIIQAEGTAAPVFAGKCPATEAAILAVVTKLRTGG